MGKKVLVVGCGYIGFGAAVALSRAGHCVTGIIRPGKADARRKLEAKEICALEADAHNVASYADKLEHFDVVIDCLSPWPSEDGKSAKSVGILDAVAEIAKRTKKTRRYIFTGGVMSYGDQKGRLIDETTPPNPDGLLLWKAGYEESVRNRANAAEFLETVDVRPGWVYGGPFEHKAYANWFEIAENADIHVVGAADKKWPWIHTYDLSNAYVALVEAPGDAVTGQLFNITDETDVPNADIQEAFARCVWGDHVRKRVDSPTDWPVALYSLLASSAKLQRVTGWKPTHGPILRNVPRLYRAWKAACGK